MALTGFVPMRDENRGTELVFRSRLRCRRSAGLPAGKNVGCASIGGDDPALLRAGLVDIQAGQKAGATALTSSQIAPKPLQTG